jgi:AAA domain
MLHKMSDEQRVVLDYIRAGHNVIVDACAGSGKSTTILSIAKELSGKKIRQFTYNAMLRHEVKEKVKDLGLHNLQVHTYHSFAVNYYSDLGHTDTGIRSILRENMAPRIPIPLVDLVVLDESQDMTKLYFQLIVKMSKDMMGSVSGIIKPFQLLVLGDYMQGLYEFKGADIRFLTHAEQVWSVLPYLQSPIFKQCTLKTSYRITNQMANFVNRDMLGEDRLLACRDGSPVVYIRRPRHQIEKIVVYQINRLLLEGESPSDIFVLGGSVKGANSHIRHMENTLTLNDIPCHVPAFETDAMDERVIEGKVVFSTFHTAKGRQRKYVFVVGFDQGYFYNARTLLKTVCPNTLYVGCTRATHGLFLLENDSSRPLEFLKRTQHDMKHSDYIDFKGIPQTIFHTSGDVQDQDESGVVLIPTYHVAPTELIKFVKESTLERITPVLDKIFVQEVGCLPENEILIPTMIRTSRGLHEDVSDLNGIAIPAMYFDSILTEKRGSAVIMEMIQESVKEMKPNSHGFLKQRVQELPTEFTSPADYLYLANVYSAVQEKLYSKLRQIDREEYSWITPEMMARCSARLQEYIVDEENKDSCSLSNLLIEHSLIHFVQEEKHTAIEKALYPFFSYETRFRFSARADLITESTLWELKCTSKISQDHLMQLVIYAWIWRLTNPQLETGPPVEKAFKIMNIRTGERLRLEATLDELTFIVVELLKGKYGGTESLDNEDFVQECVDHILETTS